MKPILKRRFYVGVLALVVFGAPWLPAQPIFTTAPVSQTILAGSNVTFRVVVAGAGPFAYQWQCAGTNLPADLMITVAGNGAAALAGDGGPATQASLHSPLGLTVDAGGNLFIADNYNACIRKVDTNGLITTVAGNGSYGNSGSTGAATNLSLANPAAVAVDGAGDVFFLDNGNSRLCKVTPGGWLTTVLGSGTLSDPLGLAADSSGNLYVADAGNNRVLKVNPSGAFSTVAGNGSSTYSGDNGPATAAGVHQPFGVGLDPAGNLYIAESSSDVIRKVDTNGVITTVVGNGYQSSYTYYVGDGLAATNATLFEPYAVAVDAVGNIFVADTFDDRIRKVDTNGIISSLAGGGASSGENISAATANLGTLEGVALDADGNVFFTDTSANRVREVVCPGPKLPLTNLSTNSAGDYTVIVTSPSGSVTSSVAHLTIVLPPSVAAQPQNLQVLAGTNAVFAVQAGGTAPLNYQWLFNGAPVGGATNAVYPLAAATPDLAGNYSVLVTNLYGSVTSSVAALTTVPLIITRPPRSQNGLLGSNVTFTVVAATTRPLAYQWLFNGTNLPGATAASCTLGPLTLNDAGNYSVILTNIFGSVTSSVASLAVVQLGIVSQPLNLVVFGGSNALFNVAPTGIGPFTYRWLLNGTNLPNNQLTTIAGNGMAYYSGDGGPATNASIRAADGVSIDGDGQLFIADTADECIREVDATGTITTVAGQGSSGYSGDGGAASAATLNSPTKAVFDPWGNMFIADAANSCIRKVDLFGVITTVAGGGTNAFPGNGLAATNVSLGWVQGMICDANGDLYIADNGNSSVRRVDTSGFISTVAGTGTNGFGGDGGLATQAQLYGCSGLAFDAAGGLLIADTDNNRIRRVDPSGVITTMAGSGTNGFAGDGGPARNANLNLPAGLAVDASGNVLIADYGNRRIRLVDTNGFITTVAGGGSSYPGEFEAATNVNLSNPEDVTVDATGNWIFTDTGNYRIREVHVTGLPALVLKNSTTNMDGNYSVVISDPSGSVTSSVASLLVVYAPAIVTPPTNQFVLAGNSAAFSVAASGTAPLAYQWLFNGVALPAQTNASLALVNLAPAAAGNYSVIITNSYGSVTSRLAVLGIGGAPLIVAQPTNQAWLAGSRVLLSAGVAGVGPFTFQWQLNGTNLLNNVITTIAGNGTNGFAGDGGLATTGKISLVEGLVADNAGNVWIADGALRSPYSSNNRIRKVDVNGIMTTVAGTNLAGFAGDGGPATNARIYAADSVAVDAAGNLYIADTGNNRVRKVDPSGVISTVAGKSSTGGFSGDGGAATNALLYAPTGVAVDASGNLFIADSGNERVRKMDANGLISTVAGKSSAGFSGDGGPATNATFNQPFAVAVDAAGNLFVTDQSNYRVRKVDTNGTITTVAGSSTVGSPGDGILATNARLYAPYGIAVDSFGDLFIADSGYGRIRRVDPFGIITSVAGTNGYSYNGDGLNPTNAMLNNPCGVAVDGYGRIVVADSFNYRIRRFGQGPVLVLDKLTTNQAGNYALIVSSSFGSVTSSVAALTVLLPPAFVTPLASQSVGLGSNATFTVNLTGTAPMAYQWQMNGTNLPGQTGPALNLVNAQWSDAGNYGVIITNNYGSLTSSVAALTVVWPPNITNQPVNLMVLAGGTATLSIGVAGAGPFSYRWQLNSTNLPDGIISTVAGNGVAGYSGDGGNALSASMKPYGVAVDASGNVFVAELANQVIRRVDTNGLISTVAGTGTAGFTGDGGPATSAMLKNPFGLALDALGEVLIADGYNNRLRKIDLNGWISTVAGNSSYGYAGDGGAATNTSLDNPWAVTVDAAGNIFFSDEYNYRIRKVNTNGAISTLAGGGASDPGKGGAATSAKLYDPLGIAVDAAGNVYFADDSYRRIYQVATNGTILPVAGSGTNGFSGDGGLATNANLSRPTGVALDSSGNLFFADSSNYRVRKVDANGVITTVAGSGVYGYAGDGGSATSAALRSPEGVAVDASGNLYIADNANNRIRKVTTTRIATLVLNNVSPTNAGTYQVVVTAPGGVLTSSSVTLTVLTPPALRPAPQFDAMGNLTLNLSTTPNVSSRIFVATNLTPPVVWQPVYTNAAGGAWQFTDTNAPGQPQRFYRITTP